MKHHLFLPLMFGQNLARAQAEKTFPRLSILRA
jgi:hypothetical protein